MFEVHYRDSATRTTMTFIFNNSRITLILDAILDIYNFIMVNWDKPIQGMYLCSTVFGGEGRGCAS